MIWLQLESSAQVLTEYGHELGMPQQWEFIEMPSLDLSVSQAVLERSFESTKAIIMIAPISVLDRMIPVNQPAYPDKDLIFIKQTIDNACGAIALFHVLLNTDSTSIISGIAELDTAAARGLAVENNQQLLAIHQKYCNEGSTDVPDLDADTDLHFIVFIAKGCSIYCMDGRRDTPLLVTLLDSDFASSTCKFLEEKLIDETDNRIALLALIE